jgi:hypothetical protein
MRGPTNNGMVADPVSGAIATITAVRGRSGSDSLIWGGRHMPSVGRVEIEQALQIKTEYDHER